MQNQVEWSSPSELEQAFEEPEGSLKGIDVVWSLFGYPSYEGYCNIVFIEDGKLYEVNGSHCSCNGFEGQWTPEPTSFEALAMREWKGYEEYDQDELNEVKRIIYLYVSPRKVTA